MRLIDILLPEFDRETGTTRRVLERVPDAALEWKPHDKSMTLGGLAAHVVDLPGWTASIMNQNSFDLAAEGPISTAAAYLDRGSSGAVRPERGERESPSTGHDRRGAH